MQGDVHLDMCLQVADICIDIHLKCKHLNMCLQVANICTDERWGAGVEYHFQEI